MLAAASQGRPKEALQIARSVLDGDYRLSPRLRALFLTRKARALAQGGDDSALSLGEVEAYAKVLNCDVNIAFSRRGATTVDRIKQHAFAIRRELEKLAECAHADESIACGVADSGTTSLHGFGQGGCGENNDFRRSRVQFPAPPSCSSGYLLGRSGALFGRHLPKRYLGPTPCRSGG